MTFAAEADGQWLQGTLGLTMSGRESNRGTGVSLDAPVRRVAIVATVVAVLLLAVVITLYATTFPSALTEDHQRWAEFGDFFGGTLNPFFGLLSLLAILFTLIIQARELSCSTRALEEQSRHLGVQAFENTFFSLVGMHNENVKGLTLQSEEIDSSGRDVFKHMFVRLKDAYSAENYTKPSPDARELIERAYNRFYAKQQKNIGHYIRTLNRLLDFIEKRGPENKNEYWLIIRAQLSANELIILYYHSIVRDRFAALATLRQYRFFEYLPLEDLIDPEVHGQWAKQE